jgi:hypothetical protein
VDEAEWNRGCSLGACIFALEALVSPGLNIDGPLYGREEVYAERLDDLKERRDRRR